jgi:integrase
MVIITSIPKDQNDLVFPARGNGKNVISGFTRAKNRLDRLSGIKDWTLHDLRRTAATHLAKLGTPPHIIERVLNHVSGSFGGVAGVYNRRPYFEEMRAALQAWGEQLAAMPAHESSASQRAPERQVQPKD